MADLSSILLDVARTRGARVSVRLNAWPGEIQLADARSIDGGGGPGLLQGQVIVRDDRGQVITTIGPDVRQNWLLTGAVVAGLGVLLFIVVRGIAPRSKG